jgi:hypothetical protein
MADKKRAVANRVKIDLNAGMVEVESGEASIGEVRKIANDIAKKLTNNNRANEWGIR